MSNLAHTSEHDLLDEAAGRFARIRSGDQAQSFEEELEEWLADPECTQAFAQVEQIWHAIQPLYDDPRMLALREEARESGGRFRWFRYSSLAAGVALSLFTGIWYHLATPPNSSAQQDFEISTVAGQRIPVKLADGSSITLDARSSVRVRLGANRREISLQRGRALFRVSHDPERPFVVSIGRRSVTALGTVFSVDTHGKALDVVLVEGKVRVLSADKANPAAIDMTAGSRLRMLANGHWEASRTDADEATAWLRGQLVFEDAPLSEVVPELNRYTQHPIDIADASTGNERLTAVLSAGDIASFTQAVALLDLARVERRPDGSVILRKKSSRAR